MTTVTDSPLVQRAIGVVNGSLGYRVDLSGGPGPELMTVRVDHTRVDLDRESLAARYPRASGRLVVFLHGLIETERSWFHRASSLRHRTGTDFGSRLAEDFPSSPVYVRYHTGRHISDNGRALGHLLSDLIAGWPVPVTEIVLVGHSMGGLVARSALHQAAEHAAPWLPTVSRLICLGSPHTGAPLERLVARVTALLNRLVVTVPLARLLELRSDGIKDLGHGYLSEKQWLAETFVAEAANAVLPVNIRQLFLTATLSRFEDGVWARLVGDLMVGPASAAHRTQIADRGWLGGINHFDLTHHDDAYNAMIGWLCAA